MALLFLLCLLCLSVSAEGRTWHNFNGFQYSIEMTPVTSYAEAETGCSALQAEVANVKTTAIFEFLKTYINLTDKPFSLYIGSKRIGNTTKFQWNDESGVSFPSRVWGQRQPNNLRGNDNCITMGFHKYPVESTSYRWWDVPCTNHNARYICEKTVADSPKPNTAIIASAVGGCVILVIICIVIVFVTSWRKRRRNRAVNEAVVIEYNARGDEIEPEETYNIPQIEENSFANHSIQPSSRHQDDDVNHYHAIREPRHENIIVDEVARPQAGSSDVYAQVRKSKQSTKVHDNGQQSRVQKYDHNQLDEVSYDTLQSSQHVEVQDPFASVSNPTNIYDNRQSADDKSDSAYDEIRRHK
uniref:C-type lectin domain family 4 member G-like n=1 Tax=Phallusia mammillata TaxID=59560 RepID=A0A6F9DA46_9ASCI|nr:C-type lectin domain family 4 member G-like [Phallusia mammillata]